MQQVNDVLSQVSDIDERVEKVNRVSSGLSISYYSLIVWIVLVTFALAAVGSLSMYRRRSQRRPSLVYAGDSNIISAEMNWETVERRRPSGAVDRGVDQLSASVRVDNEGYSNNRNCRT